MATFLNYPFDADLFIHMWRTAPNPVFQALINSGALANDAVIQGQMNEVSNLWTAPFYQPLVGTLQNYDGVTNMTSNETAAVSQSGVVYGRMISFRDRDFMYDFHGADPMGHIVASIADFHNFERQKRVIGILEGIFGITGDTDWSKHIVTTGADITETTINTVAQMALGDNKAQLALAIMHSAVATQLQNLGLLEYAKYTSPQGIETPTNIAFINNLTVIVSDEVPVSGNAYTTYLLGRGALRFATAPVKVPASVARDEALNGGSEALYTRIREVIHPNGFNFNYQASMGESPVDTDLFLPANYSRVFNAKALPFAKLVTTVTPTP